MSENPETVTPTVTLADALRDAGGTHLSIFRFYRNLGHDGESAPGGTRTHDLTPQTSCDSTPLSGETAPEGSVFDPSLDPKRPQTSLANRNESRNGPGPARVRVPTWASAAWGVLMGFILSSWLHSIGVMR